MKRFVAICLLVLMLPSFTLAEGIRAQMNAPERLEHSFSSNSGKTTIFINADVEVPDVQNVNLYEVISQEIPAQNLIAFADYVMGEGAWNGDTAYGVPESIVTGGNFPGVTQRSIVINSTDVNEKHWPMDGLDAFSTAQDGILRGGQIMNLWSRRDPWNFNYNYFMMHDQRGKDARNCTYSHEEATAIATKAASILAPELTEVSAGLINCEGDSEVGDFEAEAYLFNFTRNVDGIPVTYTIQECSEVDVDANDKPIYYKMLYPYESLRLVVTNQGITAGRYESPYKISGPIQENVTLLPFDQAVKIAEKILPLVYVWLENTYRVEVKVDRIAFGYARLDFKDDMYRYMLVPVWDFFGTYECYRDGELVIRRMDDYSSLLTINAMDGTVIDRRYGY